jgi:hypothetical protein
MYPSKSQLRRKVEAYSVLVNRKLESQLGNTELLSADIWLKAGYLNYYDIDEKFPKMPPHLSIEVANNKRISLILESKNPIERLIDDVIKVKRNKINICRPSKKNIKNIKEAIEILSNYYLPYEIEFCLDAISFISGKNIIAFTAIEEPGIIFFKPRSNEESLLFFCEHLVHEVSHVALNYMIVDINEYFKINPFEAIFNSPFRIDKRGLYHVIHALYVLAKITFFFNRLSKTELIKNNQYSSEIFGRLALASYRLEKNINEIDGPFYTKKGDVIINFIKKINKELCFSKNKLVSQFDLTGQSIEYNHNLFLKNNLF